MPWRFLVIDGADKEQVFPLPETGVVVIGSSQKHADICLHDLYVQRTHCEAEVTAEGTVEVRNLRPTEGMLVNKVRAEQQQLNAGDVLRVGNSCLRLEPASEAGPAPTARAAAEAAAAPPEPKPEASVPLPNLPPDRLAELTGHLLGHYRLGQVLSKSSHKAVFVALDRKTQESVVVQVLSPRFPAKPEESQRFIEAMRKSLQLRHESLVMLRGAGKTGPYTWIVRDHVPGENLAGVLERVAGGSAKPKWQSAMRLARQIGGALDYLHRQRVMHGRLTPSTILVNIEKKQARLANVMIDRAFKGSELGTALCAARLTRDVPYFSPEQCELGAFIDEMSDQYALGALVYARMTGQPPFLGATPAETIKLIRTGPLVRPRERNASIPAKAEAVVLRMLSRHQEDRYLTPEALLADLDAINSN